MTGAAPHPGITVTRAAIRQPKTIRKRPQSKCKACYARRPNPQNERNAPAEENTQKEEVLVELHFSADLASCALFPRPARGASG